MTALSVPLCEMEPSAPEKLGLAAGVRAGTDQESPGL